MFVALQHAFHATAAKVAAQHERVRRDALNQSVGQAEGEPRDPAELAAAEPLGGEPSREARQENHAAACEPSAR